MHCSEAVILRTWPVHEADLIVSFFARDYGRIKGVAKSALKSRKRFGGALEPMTLSRAWFAERPRQELVRLDSLEIVRSPLSAPVDHARMAALSFFAEVLEEILPERDSNDAVYRLVVSVLEQTTAIEPESAEPLPGAGAAAAPLTYPPSAAGPLACGARASGPWMALTYFSLWMTRLMGLLPDIAHCIVCGEWLREDDAAFHLFSDGLVCHAHRAPNAIPLGAGSWRLAQRMLREPAAVFAVEPWPRRRAQDLRRFTVQTLERHLERKLRSAEALARLGA